MYLIVLFLLTAFFQFAPENQSETDSLLQVAEKMEQDTNKVLLLNKASQILQYNDPERAEEINEEALALSRKLNYQKGISYSLVNLAYVQIVQGKYESAKKLCLELIELGGEKDLFESRTKGLNRLAVIHYYQGNYQEAIKINLEILHHLDSFPLHRSRLNALNNIGINYERLEDQEKALDYYDQALELAQINENRYAASAIAGNMGVIYKNLGRLDEAKELILQSIEGATELNNVNLFIDETSNLAEIYILEGNYADALNYIDQSQKAAEESNDKNGVIKSLTQRGIVLHHQGNQNQAIQSLRNGLSLADSIGDREILVSLYKHLHLAYAASGDFGKAYSYHQSYTDLRDTIFRNEQNEELNLLETRYQTAEKERLIQSQQLEIERQSRQRSQLTMAAIFLGILVVSTTIFFLYRLRINRQLMQQKEVIQSQKINALKNEQKIQSLSAMIDGQESERIRIAKDLHDGLGGILTGVKGQVRKLEKNVSAMVGIEMYSRTNELVDEAVSEVRKIAQNLMPGILRLEGLNAALEDLCDRAEDLHGLKVEKSLGLNYIQLTETQQILIYRIFQELINNIVKHANASEMVLQANLYDDHINLIVEDDGEGFDPLTIQHNNGLGLSSVASRVDLLNGEMEIHSMPTIGTSVSINIPYHEIGVR